MTAAEIAAVLGAAGHSGEWWRCLCPVHGSRTGRSATLALSDGERGLIAVCHAGCDRSEVLDELRRRRLVAGHPEAVSGISRSRITRELKRRRGGQVRQIWQSACEARGTPLVRYFAGRGIIIALPASLRYAASLRHPSGISAPAMVAAIVDVAGDLIGLHRTYL